MSPPILSIASSLFKKLIFDMVSSINFVTVYFNFAQYNKTGG